MGPSDDRDTSVAGIQHYHRPPDLDAAWALLRAAGPRARALAGGSDLVLRSSVDTLVDLADTGIDAVHADAEAVRMGAMATFTDLLEHPAVTAVFGGLLRDVLADLGSVLHRNTATIGGHLARARMSDLIPALLAADAEVVVRTDTTATVTLAAYLDREPGPHILTEVRIATSDPTTAAGAFERFTRTAVDHALVNAACAVHTDGPGGPVTDARVVVGQTGAIGRRLPAAEAALIGSPLSAPAAATAAAAASDTVDARGDALASADYRRHLAGVGVARCVQRTADRLSGEPR